MSSKGRVDEVADAIERYLSDNPAAADTASGIRSWWLPEALRGEALSTVIVALDLLEARGVVDKVRRRRPAIYRAKTAAAHWRH